MAGIIPGYSQGNTAYVFDFKPEATEEQKALACKVAGIVYMPNHTKDLTVTSVTKANALVALSWMKFRSKHNIMY